MSAGALPWFVEAWRLIGTPEYAGPADNATIIKWAKDLGIAYGDDEIPWCGLFVAHCIGSQLPHEPLTPTPLLARGWAKFGNEVTPQPGALLVFWRGKRDGLTGHVGFYAGEEKGKGGAFHVLGGNQSDKVCVTRISKDRLLAARWPSTVPAASGGPNLVAENGGELSNNEA